ncbi:MAG: extracellular solute-binding protein [Clostridia bacterium]|nr:extracellular solute-binding protein [Clostridia bacterium]
MKKIQKGLCFALALASLTAAGGCSMGDNGGIRLTVWVSEGDMAFARQVAEDFKAANPDKQYNFVFDVQGENEAATRILNDVENAADVFSFPNDQVAKLLNGDALTRIGGDRLQSLSARNDVAAVEAATVTVGGEEGVYGFPYTDNTYFLYYDKSVLSESDVASMDGILAKCTASKKFAFPFTDGWYTVSFYFGKGLGYEVTYGDNLQETSITCNFNNQVGQQVTTSMWNLVKDSRVKADANDSKITAGFADGSIVAAVSGIWNRSSIEQSLGNNFGVAKLPTYTFDNGSGTEQVQLVSFAGYKLMGVNNYSANKAEALAFADFYTNKENQIKRFEQKGYLPTDTEAREDDRVKNDPCAAAITAQLRFSKPQKNVPSTLWEPMEGLGNAMLTGIASGNINLLEQLNACVAAITQTTTVEE